MINKKNILIFFTLGVFLFLGTVFFLVLNYKSYQEYLQKPFDIIVANTSIDGTEIYWKAKPNNIHLLSYKEENSTAPYKNLPDSLLYNDMISNDNVYSVEIQNLQPNTTYSFRIKSKDKIWDDNFTFKTKKIEEKANLPVIAQGEEKEGTFTLITTDTDNYIFKTQYHGTWAFDSQDKQFTVKEYARWIPPQILNARLNSLTKPAYAQQLYGANCNIDITINDDGYTKFRNKAIDLGNRWVGGCSGGHYVNECYNDMYCTSLEKGIDPHFVAAIWLHETGGSNYANPKIDEKDTIMDFGICFMKRGKCDPEWAMDFKRQLNQLLEITDPGYISSCPKDNEYSDNDRWGARFSKGGCSELKHLDAGKKYYTGIKEIYGWATFTNGDAMQFPFRTTSSSSACNRNSSKVNEMYRNCDSSTTKTGTSGTTGTSNTSSSTTSGDKDEMIVTTTNRKCEERAGCVCLYDKEGNNYRTRINANYGQICTTQKTVTGDSSSPPSNQSKPPSSQTPKPSTDPACSGPDGYPGKMDIPMGAVCKDPSGCECFEGSKFIIAVACGETCAEKAEVEETEKVCCLTDKTLSIKSSNDCEGTIREDIPSANCRSEKVKYTIKKGVSFINPVEIITANNSPAPQTAYELINLSDKRIISVGEYKSGQWIQIVKYVDGKIYGNDFRLDSNKSYMITSLQEAEFNLTGYRIESLDILKLSGWNLVPSSVFDNKGRTSYAILKNLEFNKIKQIGQWQDSKSLFEYTIKNDKNEIYGKELKIGDQDGIFIKVIQ